MHGHIAKFDDLSGVGVIAAEDGRRFRFLRSQLTNSRRASIGEDVDFLLEVRCPKDIFVLSGSPWTAFAIARGRPGG